MPPPNQCTLMLYPTNPLNPLPRRLLGVLLIVAALLGGQPVTAAGESGQTLEQLTEERQRLTSELEQYQRTIALVHSGDTPPEESANPAIRSLAVQAAALKSRLIEITEQEVTLLQRRIVADRTATGQEVVDAAASAADTGATAATESKPLRTHNIEHSHMREAENVERLHGLLQDYYAELQESARILPTEEEIAQRRAAQQDAESLRRIPFSVDKVRLSGSEGSMALAQITSRLMDPLIPESRRDIAPICLIKTRLFDTLVGSENRSLIPVGKNHYVARVRIQPGDTTLTIRSKQWELRLPQHANATDYLITLYRPVEGEPELHVFAVEDLLGYEDAHIPAWLPDELDIPTTAG